jgi:hypothetical protein
VRQRLDAGSQARIARPLRQQRVVDPQGVILVALPEVQFRHRFGEHRLSPR